LQDLKRSKPDEHDDDHCEEGGPVGSGPPSADSDCNADPPAAGPAADRPVEPNGVHPGDVPDLPA
jgi:hypothetical protein